MSEVKQIIKTMNAAIKENSALVKGIKAVYQFHLKDNDPDTYQFVLRDENSYIAEGIEEKADCTLHIKADNFIKLAKGELNGITAFLSGKLKIEDNMGMALKLEGILSLLKVP